MTFVIGVRVRVSEGHYWASGATGTVAAWPSFAAELGHGTLIDETVKLVPTRSGSMRTLWIIFDEPQFDVDGDGPYAEAEIPASALVVWTQQ
ncbi:hypothetical protein [Caulobacter sp. 17J65-9]|uniref:hypothetical protein n=1 Tax=Caulobacter sp. 17J65-9 TaxID=2709382 RepID=UPI0013C899CB|nr:hypothetical protein [Caulobacter sp. 17J65-9]NEX92756.1 hypothetical protein [Caulobacter sp. 17J65-9]